MDRSTGLEIMAGLRPMASMCRHDYFFPLTRLNVGDTDLSDDIVTVQVNAVPVHAPLQPAKVLRDPGVAVSVTLVFAASE